MNKFCLVLLTSLKLSKAVHMTRNKPENRYGQVLAEHIVFPEPVPDILHIDPNNQQEVDKVRQAYEEALQEYEQYLSDLPFHQHLNTPE